MDQDIKNRWVNALRSGEYQQTKNWLVRENGYCCLGVLCEIAVQDGVVIEEAGGYTSVEDNDDRSYEDLPKAVQHWAGLDSENPLSDVEFAGPDSEYRATRQKFAYLSELNDDMDYDFERIAEVIDRVF